MRTKTSGPGKPVKSLQFYVSKDCWIDEPYWLQIGWELWEALGKEAGLADRDFLLPVPGSSLESLTRKVTSYADASTLAKALLSNLPSDETGDELLRPGLAAFLTEHSERASLRSWASAASVSSATSRRLHEEEIRDRHPPSSWSYRGGHLCGQWHTFGGQPGASAPAWTPLPRDFGLWGFLLRWMEWKTSDDLYREG